MILLLPTIRTMSNKFQLLNGMMLVGDFQMHHGDNLILIKIQMKYSFFSPPYAISTLFGSPTPLLMKYIYSNGTLLPNTRKSPHKLWR